MADEKNTQFNYLLNAFELATQAAEPAKYGYAEKRRALLAHVRELERKAAVADRLDAPPGRTPEAGQCWKVGDEFLPFHPQASHVRPDFRDGWNRCFWMAVAYYAGALPDGHQASGGAGTDGGGDAA